MNASSARKQLNVRSDEAYERAHRIARQRRTSVTAVIEQALQRYEKDIEGLGMDVTPEQADENKRILDQMLAEMWGPEGPPKGFSSDHSWMYDEDGLPK